LNRSLPPPVHPQVVGIGARTATSAVPRRSWRFGAADVAVRAPRSVDPPHVTDNLGMHCGRSAGCKSCFRWGTDALSFQA